MGMEAVSIDVGRRGRVARGWMCNQRRWAVGMAVGARVGGSGDGGAEV